MSQQPRHPRRTIMIGPTWSIVADRYLATIALVGVLTLGMAGGCNLRSGDKSSGAPESDEPELALSTEQAKYLQDVEHLGGFVLGDLAFPKVAQALKDKNREELTAFFAEDFSGSLFDNDGGTPATYPFATLRTWSDGHDAPLECDRESFVAQLLALRDELAELESAKFKVMLMSPETRGDLEGSWRGSFKFILAGKTADGSVAQHVIKFHCRIAKITDETPDQRNWFLECKPYKAKYSASQEPLMVDMTAETGIDADHLTDNWKTVAAGKKELPFMTGGLYMADYNQDGRMDVLLTDINGPRLYRGEAEGRFVDVTEEAGLPANVLDVLVAAFADLDNDGFEDLILGSYVFRNDKGERFEQLAPEIETNLQLESASGYAVADYDRDGLLDLMAVGIGESEGKVKWIGENSVDRNRLWRNLGDWQFEDVTEKSGTRGLGHSAFAGIWFDANGDDWPDLMTSCEFGMNDYLLNQGDGTFKSGELPDIYGGFSMGITVADIDNDGFGDPYVANMYSKAGERVVGNLDPKLYPPEVDAQLRDFVSGNELYRNLGDGRFERIGKAAGVSDVGWAYGTGYMDLNCDGLVDMYAPVGYQSVSTDKPDG